MLAPRGITGLAVMAGLCFSLAERMGIALDAMLLCALHGRLAIFRWLQKAAL